MIRHPAWPGWPNRLDAIPATAAVAAAVAASLIGGALAVAYDLYRRSKTHVGP